MAPQAHHHRATLKQSNKSFKSKHASKGSLKAAAKGKTESLGASGGTRKADEAGSKRVRLNQQTQKREAKQRNNRDDAKLFSTSSGGGKVPRIVTVVPLLPSVSTERFLLSLLPSLGLSEEEVAAASSKFGGHSSVLVSAPRFKTAILFNLVPALELYATLDAALVSDTVILLMSSVDEVQLDGEAILRCLQGQTGGVNILSCVQAPESNPLTPSTRSLIHKSLLSFSRYFFPDVAKIFSTDTANEALLLARSLCELSPKSTRHPDGRSWIVAEGDGATEWQPAGDDDGSLEVKGNLRVVGTIRGAPMSANRLVHLPGHGDFEVTEIIEAPASEGTARTHKNAMDADSPTQQLSKPDESADDLTSHNVPDLLANEQTWPTEEEMMSAPAQAEGSQRKVKRVPKGTSAYQAAWIVDDDDDNDIDAEDDEDDSADGMDDDSEHESAHFEHDEAEEMEEIELEAREDRYQDLDAEDEEAEYEAYLQTRKRAQQDDLAFPDEIDTPRHLAARERFQRYRGLRSFRTSPWDPYENLPLEYGEIFQFENFAATQKRVIGEATIDGVEMGTRVIIVLRNVPRSVIHARQASTPLILHGLLRHEHKQTVLHFVVQRNTEYAEPVAAKDPLVLCVGPRRYDIRPLLSQHVRGGGKGVNNVHKSERFLRHGMATVVTTFGPVCFGKAPCLLLRQNQDSAVPALVAMGSFMSSDPTRIIAKRIVLTGHPFKVHKKTATIRYMFFNREDVDYFNSVELHTKYGRTGHVREALGTHGYFKAHFDGPIQQMDTICMNLYKRQYPKWSSEFKPAQVAEVSQEEGSMDVE